MEKKEFTLTFDIYEGKDGQTWFVEKYKEIESGKSLYRYGYGSTETGEIHLPSSLIVC